MKEIRLYISEKLKLNRDSEDKNYSEYTHTICDIIEVSDNNIKTAINEWVGDYSDTFMYLYVFAIDAKHRWSEKCNHDNIKLVKMGESTMRFVRDAEDRSEIIYKSDKYEDSVDNIAEIRVCGTDLMVFFETSSWQPVIFEKKRNK